MVACIGNACGFGRMGRLFALFVFVLIAAGCAPRNMAIPLGEGEKAALGEKVGVVVLGQGLDWNPTLYSGGLLDNCDSFATYWHAMDENPPPAVSNGVVAGRKGCLGDNPRIRYNVLVLPPGRYALQSIKHRRYRTLLQTDLFAPVEKPSYEQLRVPKFSLAAGEVVYLGDLVFSGPPGGGSEFRPFSPKLKAMVFNEAAAREELSSHNIDPNGMVVRRLF